MEGTLGSLMQTYVQGRRHGRGSGGKHETGRQWMLSSRTLGHSAHRLLCTSDGDSPTHVARTRILCPSPAYLASSLGNAAQSGVLRLHSVTHSGMYCP